MAGKELGTKHTCFKCGTKFYDFRKPEPLCPKCGADQRQAPVVKAPAAERRSKAASKPEPEETETVLDEGAEDAEADAELEDEDEEETDDDA
jgi:uncharacterized protein (TIGR02300 family)